VVPPPPFLSTNLSPKEVERRATTPSNVESTTFFPFVSVSWLTGEEEFFKLLLQFASTSLPLPLFDLKFLIVDSHARLLVNPFSVFPSVCPEASFFFFFFFWSPFPPQYLYPPTFRTTGSKALPSRGRPAPVPRFFRCPPRRPFVSRSPPSGGSGSPSAGEKLSPLTPPDEIRSASGCIVPFKMIDFSQVKVYHLNGIESWKDARVFFFIAPL